MKLRIYAAALLFVGSYFPLSLILLAQDINYSALSDATSIVALEWECRTILKNPNFSIPIATFSFVCFVLTIIVLRLVTPKTPIKLTDAKHVPADLMNYTLPYVVSFMSFDYQETGKFVGILIFLGWMFLISHRSGQVILNPLLIVFGWRHYELKYVFSGDDREFSGQALSKDVLEPGMHCKQSAVQDILVLRANVEGA